MSGNDHPTKKASKWKKCADCGQFAAASHLCAVPTSSKRSSTQLSFANAIVTNQSLGVLYVNPDENVRVCSIDDIYISRKCRYLELGFLILSKPITEAEDTKLTSVIPNNIERISGDGNCLFTSLAVSIGMSHGCGPIIRNLIVKRMKNLTWPANALNTSVYSLEFPNRSRVVNCTSVEEYLAMSKMYNDGVYGGCVEIFAFCAIFEIDVYVYHKRWSLWLIYPCSRVTERRGVFLQQTINQNHFEVIRDLKETPSVAEQGQSLKKKHVNTPLTIENDDRNMKFDSLLQNRIDKKMEIAKRNELSRQNVRNGLQNSSEGKRCAFEVECEDSKDNGNNNASIYINPPKKMKSDENETMTECSIRSSMANGMSEKEPFCKTWYSLENAFKSHATQSSKQLELLTGKEVNDEQIMKITTVVQTPNANFFVMGEDIHEKPEAQEQVCSKCKRQAVLDYPLKLKEMLTKDLMRRKFGAKLLLPVSYLCKTCLSYCSPGEVTWGKAWPSVFFTLLSDCSLNEHEHGNICALLPWSLRQQWIHYIENFPLSAKTQLNRLRPNDKLTVDGTLRLFRFHNLINSLEQKNLADALDEEPYPNVRCPFGCWCFIEENGYIPMQHFLNLFLDDFTAFKASWQLYLRGYRRDFLFPSLSLNKFLVAATVRIDEKAGLVMQTCTEHSKGSSLQYIHVPTHPKLFRMCPPFDERLALATPTLRGVTSVKANFASHTYQLLRSSGSYSGISTVQLRSRNRWDITSDLLNVAEGYAFHNRRDVQMLIKNWVKEGKIIDDIAFELNSFCPDKSQIVKSLESATKIELADCLRLLKCLNGTEEDILSNALVLNCYTFAHANNDHGAPPPVLKKNTSGELWFLQCATCLSPPLCRTIATSKKQIMVREQVLKFLNQVIFRGQNKSRHQKDVEETLNRSIEELVSNNEPLGSPFERSCLFLAAVCDGFEHVHLQKRSELKDKSNKFSSKIQYLAITTTKDNTLRNKYNPHVVVVKDGLEFELVLLGEDGDCATDSRILIRHGGSFKKFWKMNRNINKAIPSMLTPEKDVETFSRGYWTVLLYKKREIVEVSDLKWQFFGTMTGQGIFICEDHQIPLSKDLVASGFFCRCGKSSFLRCAVGNCSSCVCRFHFKKGLENPNLRILVDSTAKVNQNAKHCEKNDNISEKKESITESESSAAQSSTEFFFVGGACDKNATIEAIEGLTKVTPLPVEELVTAEMPKREDEQPIGIPLHILLNSQCSLLHRRKSAPIHLSAREKRFLENVAATSACSLPLIQPEAMLFPTLFWHQDDDGTYSGAIPTVLFKRRKYNKQLGFEGIEGLLRTRIKDGNLLLSCSTPYLQFAFDTLLNIELSNAGDVRLVMNRGWQELGYRQCSTSFVTEHNFKFDSADSRKNVSELAALIRDVKPTYFFTYTCGSSTHPGLRKIFAAIDEFCPPGCTPQEWRLTIIQAELMPMLGSWHRASQYVMNWIVNSPEKPLGPVSHFWMRYEWQEETAAFPHIHALIFTNEDKFSTDVRSRICCSKENFLGNLALTCPWLTAEDQFQLGELFQRYQSHNCKKGKRRCEKVTERSEQPVCRVPKYPASQQFSFKEITQTFSPETIGLLSNLGLTQSDNRTCNVELNDSLKAGKHHYPCNYGEHISPTNAPVFALTQSSTNVQICDDYMCARYIAKYAAGVESRVMAKIIAGRNSDSVKVVTEKVHNEKIAGVKRKLKKEKQNEKQFGLDARIVSTTECLWWTLQLPYVCTNVDFVHVATVPKEFRTGVALDKTQKITYNFSNTFLQSVKMRKDVLKLPKVRLFTKKQEVLLEDVEKSSITPDKVTVFGLRPPELLFVNNLKDYFSWFTRTKTKSTKHPQSMVKTNLGESCWVDGLGYTVKLRPSAIAAFINLCMTDSKNGRDEEMKKLSKQSIIPLLENCSPNPLFIDTTEKLSAVNGVVVFSNCLPNNPTKFLLHILLTFGTFETELDLLNVESIKEAFVAGHIVEEIPVSLSEVQRLTRDYLMKQLRFIPGSSRMIDKFLPMAYSVFVEALTANNLFFASAVPAALDETISEEYEEGLAVDLILEKCRLISFLQKSQSDLPAEQVMIDATVDSPVNWKPCLKKHADQTMDSYREQSTVLEELINCIENYKKGGICFIRHQIVLGPPGTGKTFVMMKALSYAICQGLVCVVTSLAAERSAALAGKHLNALIPFPVEKNASAEILFKKALSVLQRTPNKCRYLQKLDILCIEEISMISSELWAATDQVLQIVSANFVPFGGKLVIATGDFFQLPPPSGTCLIRSSFLITSFVFHSLKHFVRMQNKLGQEVLMLMSTVPRTLAIAKRIWEILQQCCCFVDSWPQVSKDAIRVFATRNAERKATAKKITEVKESGCVYAEVEAVDEMCVSSTDAWIEASQNVKSFLNKKCLEPQTLFLYPGAILRLTVNKPALNAYQGQLCVLVDMDISSSPNALTVALAPPGCRTIPALSVIKETWRCIVLHKEIGVPFRLNFKTVGRRNQFPVKLYVASTIHKTMGETLPSVATQIVGSKEFSLWLIEQLYVVVSRVRNLGDVTFVGSKESNEQSIISLMCKRSQWTELTAEIIKKCCSKNSTIFQGGASPLPLSSGDLPGENIGCCYLLRSVTDSTLLYIGSTMCLARRILEHNSGFGSVFTQFPWRRPWTVCAYVTGFEAQHARKRILKFEKDWLLEVTELVNRNKRNVITIEAIRCAQALTTSWIHADDNLKTVICLPDPSI